MTAAPLPATQAALALVRRLRHWRAKSVHEIFLTPSERHELLHAMAPILDEEADRFFLLRLDPRSRTYALGAAAQPADPTISTWGNRA